MTLLTGIKGYATDAITSSVFSFILEAGQKLNASIHRRAEALRMSCSTRDQSEMPRFVHGFRCKPGSLPGELYVLTLVKQEENDDHDDNNQEYRRVEDIIAAALTTSTHASDPFPGLSPL